MIARHTAQLHFLGYKVGTPPHCILYAYVYNRRMNATFTRVPKTVGVSGFRANLARNLARAKKSPLIISDRKGGESYVVLGADAYNKLLELWEDERDGLELARLIKANKGKKLIPWEKVRDSAHR